MGVKGESKSSPVNRDYHLKAVGNALTTIFNKTESRQQHASKLWGKLSSLDREQAAACYFLAVPRRLYKYPLTATKVSFTLLGKWDSIYQVRIQYYLEKFIL